MPFFDLSIFVIFPLYPKKHWYQFTVYLNTTASLLYCKQSTYYLLWFNIFEFIIPALGTF